MTAKKNDKAKLATDKVAVPTHLTERRCDHCGTPIPANKIRTVLRYAINHKGGGKGRFVYRHDGH
jgi:hypothetical protein